MTLFDDRLASKLADADIELSGRGIRAIDLSGNLFPLPFGYTKGDIDVPLKSVPEVDDPTKLSDIFILEGSRGIIIYSPLQRQAVLIEEANMDEAAGSGRSWWRAAKSYFAKPVVDVWNLEWALNPKGSKPTEAVYIPTESCNLACSYCYARSVASPDSKFLDIGKALAGLAACAEEVKRQQLPVLSLRFLGGGEPTLHPDLIKACIARLRELAAHIEVRGTVSLVTNGVMPAKMADWCASNVDHITVSCDGPPELQNRNRAQLDGSASFERTANSLERFLAGPCSTDVRSTVLSDDLPRMTEIVQFFHERFKLRRLCLEPVSSCGRAEENGILMPAAERFSQEFLRARRLGRSLGMEVEYSSAVLRRLQVKFCTTMGRQFGLNPDGSITSCSEVHGRDHPHAGRILIGEMTDEHIASIEVAKVDKLRRRTLDNLPACASCFAKYHCAGGCPMRAMRDARGFFGAFESMCHAVRAIIADELDTLVLDDLAKATGK